MAGLGAADDVFNVRGCNYWRKVWGRLHNANRRRFWTYVLANAAIRLVTVASSYVHCSAKPHIDSGILASRRRRDVISRRSSCQKLHPAQSAFCCHQTFGNASPVNLGQPFVCFSQASISGRRVSRTWMRYSMLSIAIRVARREPAATYFSA